MLPTISPAEASRLLAQGAVLIDVREPDEHARARIPGATNLPLSRLKEAELAVEAGKPVLFHCQSGARTAAAAADLAAKAGGCQAFIVEGGLSAWKRAGLPVAEDRRQPLPLMQQVQIAAGSLALLGVVLGFLLTPAFFLLSGFVGAGLVMAGITGFCPMARALKAMPWNRAMAG
ncbi:MAG: rhodanese family protein [Rhodovarius sp.]|nr:rhodanese family protein [Rhodovarius sp.]MCX7932866.1 rhodanese family protein [Rhodovarius sp.]MDW8316072.1 rhodanese family protein [Rhodovarius sp.]